MKTSPRSTLLTFVAVLATVASTHAAVIVWGLPTNISGDTDVSTNGTLFGAYNFGGVGVPSATVNGVTFDPFAVPANALSVTVGNFTLATTAPNGLSGANVTTGAAPFSNLSASYKSLLANRVLPGNPDTPMTLTIAGLTVGQIYEFQWWTNTSVATSITTTATAGNSVTLDSNTTDANGGLGQFAIGTFIADNASELITFSSGQPRVSGFQLRQVPEPSTWAMLAVGAGLLLAFRRRSAARFV